MTAAYICAREVHSVIFRPDLNFKMKRTTIALLLLGALALDGAIAQEGPPSLRLHRPGRLRSSAQGPQPVDEPVVNGGPDASAAWWAPATEASANPAPQSAVAAADAADRQAAPLFEPSSE